MTESIVRCRDDNKHMHIIFTLTYRYGTDKHFYILLRVTLPLDDVSWTYISRYRVIQNLYYNDVNIIILELEKNLHGSEIDFRKLNERI